MVALPRRVLDERRTTAEAPEGREQTRAARRARPRCDAGDHHAWTLTRIARNAELEWSRTRQRSEREGILVEPAALRQAEVECLADAELRTRRREQAAARRELAEQAYTAAFGGHDKPGAITGPVRRAGPSSPAQCAVVPELLHLWVSLGAEQ